MNLPPFSALLLAGGRSTRMGVDKSSLLFENKPLWQHQLATLDQLSPSETLLSGHKNGPFQISSHPILEDPVDYAGPIAGIVQGLRHANTPWLLVLAIDIPYVPASYLAELLQQAAPLKRGVVPQDTPWWQPLAAVYPKTILPLAEHCLSNPDRSMQHFIRAAISQDFLISRPVTDAERPFFRNLNTPADLP
ncbi:MAG: molybdenum cofactor guanylyltransferase [Verrucomicrobiota bacterium]